MDSITITWESDRDNGQARKEFVSSDFWAENAKYVVVTTTLSSTTSSVKITNHRTYRLIIEYLKSVLKLTGVLYKSCAPHVTNYTDLVNPPNPS